MFKVFKLATGQERILLSGSVPTKAEAVTLAETEVATYEAHGYNDEHGFFWGHNKSDEKQVRVWVES
jgi:hypothetical protein